MTSSERVKKRIRAGFIWNMVLVGVYLAYLPNTYIVLADIFQGYGHVSYYCKINLILLGNRSTVPIAEYIASHGHFSVASWYFYQALEGIGAPARRDFKKQIEHEQGRRKFYLVCALQDRLHDYSYLPWALSYTRQQDRFYLSRMLNDSLHGVWSEAMAYYSPRDDYSPEFADWYERYERKGKFPPVRFQPLDKEHSHYKMEEVNE